MSSPKLANQREASFCSRKSWICWIVVLLLGGQPLFAFVSSLVSDTGPAMYWDPGNPDVDPNSVNPSTRAIRYYLGAEGFTAGNRANELNALRASFAQWQSVPGTVLKFEEAGMLPGRGDLVNSSDNTNIIYWVRTNHLINGGLSSISGVLGLTFKTVQTDGVLVGADIVLNGFEYSWFTDFGDKANPGYFVESTTLHEIGHFLGLEHSSMGGATMFPYAKNGVDAAAGLSSDEIAFARSRYPLANIASTLGHLRGQITMNGNGIFGAAVLIENEAGCLIGGTVTRANGFYEMTCLPLGSHKARVWPLDPAGAAESLLRGYDIEFYFGNAVTNFLPTADTALTLVAGVTNVLNLSVTPGNPAFRVAYIREPLTSPSIIALPIVIPAGQSNTITGAFSADLPTNGATLTVTGDGVTLGPVSYQAGNPYVGLNGISASISVASSATPGPRTLIIQHENQRAYANGFVEIVSPNPDSNFDGVSDTFQRQYFPLFTAAEAGPRADPDNDGVNNFGEAIAGTVPTNPLSLLKIQSTTTTQAGTTVRWQSVPGKRYQLASRTTVGSGPWQAVSPTITANGTEASFLDAGATTGTKFYRVQVVP